MKPSQVDKIQLLPEHIIDQIKAGEVIERPSTLIKEILENTIDAGSSKIELAIKNNGLDLISIIDNGKGINAQDLPLAFCRHATSKIARFEDIYSLHSYGFRGEALASIASISKLSCESITLKTKGIMKIEGGETLIHQEDVNSNLPSGTKLFIKDLFYNTPVRMKFIQSKTSEKNHIKKIINSFLLNYPQVEFHIKFDDDTKEIYPKREQLFQRIKDTVFPNKEINFLENSSTYDGVNCKVILTQESTRGNAHKSHFLFINQRYIQDIQLHKIILNTAGHLWPEGETGHYFCFLEIPSDEIDVNIHPNKTVVKIFKAPKVYSVVSGTIKAILNKQIAKTDLVPGKNFSSPAEVQSFDFENVNSGLKDIGYKKVDFGNQDAVESYFTDLHNENKEFKTEESNKIHKIGSFGLYSFNEKVFIISLSRLLEKITMNHLSREDLKDSIVPLLVSRPLKFNRKIKSTTIEFLNTLGFETDFLSQETLVIRTFPKCIQSLPYLKIVEYICNENISKLNDLNLETLKLETFLNENQINSLLKELGEFNLSQMGLLKELNEGHLASIYGK